MIADALSHNPVSLPPKENVDSGAQVAVVDSTDTTIVELLAAPPDSPDRTIDLAEKQRKDREILEIISSSQVIAVCGISGLSDQMAISFPCVRSEGHNPCSAACRASEGVVYSHNLSPTQLRNALQYLYTCGHHQ